MKHTQNYTGYVNSNIIMDLQKKNAHLLEVLEIVSSYFSKVWDKDSLGIEDEIWGKVIEAIKSNEK